MAKRKPKKLPTPVPNPGWRLFKTGAKSLLALGLAVGVLVGLAWLGGRAGTDVAPQSRYTVAFADIETSAPAGQDRQTFLTEVRFLNDLPETFQSVDPKLSERLKAAFEKHPWVLAVDDVGVSKQGRVRIGLKFREPALAVQIGLRNSELRAIDRGGVLLPADAVTAKLPTLQNRLITTGTTAGQKWPDPDVLRAVELVILYPCEKIERVVEGWQITRFGGKMLRIAAP